MSAHAEFQLVGCCRCAHRSHGGHRVRTECPCPSRVRCGEKRHGKSKNPQPMPRIGQPAIWCRFPPDLGCLKGTWDASALPTFGLRPCDSSPCSDRFKVLVDVLSTPRNPELPQISAVSRVGLAKARSRRHIVPDSWLTGRQRGMSDDPCSLWEPRSFGT